MKETRGGEKSVIELLNKEWPAPIKELEEMSEYTGPFIRTVLRHNFAPAPEDVDDSQIDVELEPLKEDTEKGEWTKAFRAGVKLALTTELTEAEASEAVGSGFIEGREIMKEIAME